MVVNKELPLTTLQSTLWTTALIVVFWTFLKKYVDKNGRFTWAESLLETHDFLTASLSVVLATYVLDIGHNVLSAKTGYEVDPYTLGYLYHLLKFYEYLDILLSVLAGNTEITKYAAFTHLFLPLWSWFRIVGRPNDSFDWRLQVIADCFVRFMSRVVPWLCENVTTEKAMLDMCEESRWYPDLIISAFWAFFSLRGQRESEQAINIFGAPYKDEATSYLLSAVVLLYAGYAKRQEDAEKARGQDQQNKPIAQVEKTSRPDSASKLTHKNNQQTSRRNR